MGTKRNGYFDIDDILMTDEPLVCTFNVVGQGLGFLEQNFQESGFEPSARSDSEDSGSDSEEDRRPDDANTGTGSRGDPSGGSDRRGSSLDRGVRKRADDLAVGSKIELPCWMAETLARRNIVTIHLPKFFGKTTRNDLRAGAPVVNLNSRCPFFYELGYHLSDLLVDDDLALVLRKAFADRCWRIVDSAGWEGKARGAMAAMKRLDNIERRLYLLTAGAMGAYDRWKERRGHRIVPPKLHRKRIRAEDRPSSTRPTAHPRLQTT